jgi:hypothetical protein
MVCRHFSSLKYIVSIPYCEWILFFNLISYYKMINLHGGERFAMLVSPSENEEMQAKAFLLIKPL